MTFEDHLKSICDRVQGSIECSLMGFDGIPVKEWKAAETVRDFSGILVEFATLIAGLRQVSDREMFGALDEVVVRSKTATAVFRILSDDYFVALIVDEAANLGKARYSVRLQALDLARELGPQVGGENALDN